MTAANPALDLWQAELRSGKRVPDTFDVLWRRACMEIEANEAQADGLTGRAEYLRQLSAAMASIEENQPVVAGGSR